MRKLFWIVLALLVVGGAQVAHADTFKVSGTAENISGGTLGTCASGASCSFSGTLTVNITTGTVTALDIMFPGLSAFDVLTGSMGVGSTWEVFGANSTPSEGLELDFETSKTPASLVGFNGGSILGKNVFIVGGQNPYGIQGGSITPSTVPEPSSVALLLLGVGILFVTRKRIGHSRPSAV